ncbi:ABC transporter ATP-binding protein [Aminipila sp.]|uniref:ABC transporter ATP-binding protein n=1 Tax=Aminipila sp. TaxID=2060095 RepID=UPI00289BD0B5|nr:ABC transporter ATP-binding protein [Aminipila sp.]
MIEYIKKTFALSETGAKDLVKAIISCTLSDVLLMFPVGIFYLLIKEFLIPIEENTRVYPDLVFYLGMSLVVLVFIFISQYIQYNRTFLASYEESANKRIDLAEHLRKIPISFFGKKDLSDLTTSIMADCAALETAFSHYMPEFAASILALIIVSGGLFAFDWRMALALLWVVPVSFAITAGGRRLQNKVNLKNNKVQLERADAIQECIEGIREIKANNQMDSYLNGIDKKLIESEKISIKSELNTAMFVVSAQMMLRVGIATTVLTGGILLIKGDLDLLTFIVFMIAATRVFEPLAGALINLAAMFSTMIQIERMKNIEQQPIQGGSKAAVYKGYDIRFDRVGFSYDEEQAVLRNVSFTAKQGEVTALVGPSGGGKSTVAKLAARFWDIQEGKITLGGTDICTVEPEALLKNYSIVFQDVLLFNNTVMENIRIGRRGATDEEVIAAAKKAQCDEFVKEMPKGYHSMIGENGSVLSGGERQRISIARALLKDSPVILMDEATASLDVENETLVQKALSNLVKDKTVIIIAHRMRTVANADKVVVLKEGEVAEQGSPSELLKLNGIYAQMARLQSKSGGWSL